MRIICIPVLLSFLSCSQPPDEPNTGDQPVTQEILGRWDVTVQGEDSYPLWFELIKKGEAITGSFQPRGGHTLPLDGIEIADDGVNLLVGENTYKGSVENDRWEGTGHLNDGSTTCYQAMIPRPTTKEAERRGQKLSTLLELGFTRVGPAPVTTESVRLG